MTNWIDISQPLSKTLAPWPGDTPFQYKLTYTKEEIGSANIGEITMSLHNGTHVDAPFHYDSDGETIDELPLDIFIGKAIVLDLSDTDTIDEQTLAGHSLDGAERVLIKTALENNPAVFPESMPRLEPDIATYLAGMGVKLLGVDMPSVDDINSKSLPVHHALHKNSIYILENIMLDHVQPGLYELAAMPLRIIGGDASPVRAAIKPLDKENTK